MGVESSCINSSILKVKMMNFDQQEIRRFDSIYIGQSEAMRISSSDLNDTSIRKPGQMSRRNEIRLGLNSSISSYVGFSKKNPSSVFVLPLSDPQMMTLPSVVKQIEKCCPQAT